MALCFTTRCQESWRPERIGRRLHSHDRAARILQNYTDSQARIIERDLLPFQEDGSIETVYSIIGWGNRPYRGFVVMRLAHWDNREASQGELVRQMRPITRRLIGKSRRCQSGRARVAG